MQFMRSAYSVGPVLSSRKAGERHSLLNCFSTELQNYFRKLTVQWSCIPNIYS